MKIVVIGGSGLIGSKLASSLRTDYGVRGNGHEVLPACRSTGVDIFTGAGLTQALAGAHVVVDVSNSSSLEDEAAVEFFETAGRNLMAAEASAGSHHHIALSIVGIDRNPEGYFRAKRAQESLIRRSGIAYTIVRSTPFFESVANIAESVAFDGAVHASPALVQPIASDDVVAVLADVALRAPVNGTIEIAGPEQLPFDEAVSRYLISRHDQRRMISDVHASYFGLELDDKSLTPGDQARICSTHFDDWLRQFSAPAIDLRTDEPRKADVELGGVKLLARVIDKGRAALAGTLGPYVFFDCPLDQIFFQAVNASRSEFLDVLRQAYTSHLFSNADALDDLRESLECEPEISNERFLAYAEACDADNAAVRWLLDERQTPPSVLAAINAAVACLPPEASIDRTSD